MRKSLVALLLVALVALIPLPAAAQSARPLTVVFKAATLPADAQAVVQAAGGTVVGTIPEIGVMSIVGPASLIGTLGKNASIAAVSPAIEIQLPTSQVVALPDDPSGFDTSNGVYYDLYQWDIKQVTKNGASFNVWTGSHATVVGIVDTGVSTQHAALAANLLGGENFVNDGPGGTVVPTDIEDRNGHGSHVAGSIAGNGKIFGIGPNLGFRSYRVFGATGGAPSTRIISGMLAAVRDGVDVISMSIGGFDAMARYIWIDPETGTRYMGKDVADFVAYRRAVSYALGHDILVVAAAGNEALNISNPPSITGYLNAEYGQYGYIFQGASREVPGTLPGVLTVSATGPDLSLASYSNYGPGAIDVAAPGGDFQRYPAPDYYLDMCLSANKGTNYLWMAGTSMATPKVSAVAALIIDQAKAAGVKLTPQQVVAKVQQTAIDIGKPGADPFFGKGFVSAYNAVTK